MSNAAHTPGPWSVYLPDVEQSNECSGVGISSNCDEHGDRVGDGNKNGGIRIARALGPDRKANARLIAAAPELLEALQSVVAIADRKTDEFDRARAAIAKATGAA